MQANEPHASSPRLRIIATVLGILALGLGALVVAVLEGDEDGAAGSAPDDVIRLVNDFALAFEEQDVELMRSIIREGITEPSTSTPRRDRAGVHVRRDRQRPPV